MTEYSTRKKLSRLQKNVLRVALLRGGRVETWDVREALYGRTLNERLAQSQMSSVSRAVSRLNGRGLTERHFAGLITLTRAGAILAAELVKKSKGK